MLVAGHTGCSQYASDRQDEEIEPRELGVQMRLRQRQWKPGTNQVPSQRSHRKDEQAPYEQSKQAAEKELDGTGHRSKRQTDDWRH
jgi:hypothetical protein